MLSLIAQFFYSQLFVTPPDPKADFSNQTVVITGANTGLGKEAARHFLRLGVAKLIIGVRTVSKGEAAADDICASTGRPRSCVEVWQIDMSSYKSVQAFAAKVKTLDRLDAFVQNAGISVLRFERFEGLESTITVNVVSATLLALLVRPKLHESAKRTGVPGRFTFVGSDTYFFATIPEVKDDGKTIFESLNDEKTTSMPGRYPQSKLLLQYAFRAIAARYPVSKDSNVIMTCLTPGLCHSELGSPREGDSPLALKLFMAGFKALLARSTVVGARTYVDAVRPDLPSAAHGQFLMDCQVFPDGDVLTSDAGRKTAAQFFKELFAKLESIAPGVTSA